MPLIDIGIGILNEALKTGNVGSHEICPGKPKGAYVTHFRTSDQERRNILSDAGLAEQVEE